MNTAVFSVLNAVLLRPLSYPDAERLVWISTYDENAREEIVPRFDYRAWRTEASRVFDRFVAYRSEDLTVRTAHGAVQARIAYVSDDFWAIVSAPLMLGRAPHEREGTSLVLSHAMFVRDFAGDPSMVGRTIGLNGQLVTIAGVLSPTFRFQLVPPPRRTPDNKDVDAYLALDAAPQDLQRNRGRTVNVVGRLRVDVTLKQARMELARVRRQLAATLPAPLLDKMPLQVVPLRQKLVGPARRILWLLLAAVLLVLVIGCVNIANLQLARLSTRRAEMATRMALGANRGQVVRQLITESAALVVVGSAGGFLTAIWAARAIVSLFPSAVPRLAEATVDARVLAFGVVASVATVVVFGVLPALSASRMNPVDAFGRSRITESRRTARGRSLLVAFEIAAAVVLLTGAGLLLRSAANLNAHPPDFHPDAILVMKVPLSGPSYADRPARDRYIGRVLERLVQVPGVSAAGVTPNYPIRSGFFARGHERLQPGELRVPTTLNAASAGYARTMGLHVISGRWITDHETAPVVVLNESLAAREFGDVDPVGHEVVVEGIWPLGPGRRPGYSTVVGVVSDVKDAKLDAAPEPQIYMPYAHVSLGQGIAVLARTSIDANTIVPDVRKAIADIDPGQPIYDIQTLAAMLDDSIAPRRLTALLLDVFAATGLLLVIAGLHGVMAFFVGQRTREIGLRLAVGATAKDVWLMITRKGMTVAAAGLLCGLLVAIAASDYFRATLYEVSPTDSTTLVAVVTIIAVLSFSACSGPALRAARSDPARTLRSE
jgi:putative ABC transport system permease protein